jgi:hypothetical protein
MRRIGWWGFLAAVTLACGGDGDDEGSAAGGFAADLAGGCGGAHLEVIGGSGQVSYTVDGHTRQLSFAATKVYPRDSTPDGSMVTALNDHRGGCGTVNPGGTVLVAAVFEGAGLPRLNITFTAHQTGTFEFPLPAPTEDFDGDGEPESPIFLISTYEPTPEKADACRAGLRDRCPDDSLCPAVACVGNTGLGDGATSGRMTVQAAGRTATITLEGVGFDAVTEAGEPRLDTGFTIDGTYTVEFAPIGG